ncbi:Uncharacterised protein at_DN0014 [Pycnogonum litorale]
MTPMSSTCSPSPAPEWHSEIFCMRLMSGKQRFPLCGNVTAIFSVIDANTSLDPMDSDPSRGNAFDQPQRAQKLLAKIQQIYETFQERRRTKTLQILWNLRIPVKIEIDYWENSWTPTNR